MRVLIAGVTGFLGSNVAHHLAGLGHDVWGLARDPGRATAVPGVTNSFRWDALQGAPPSEAFDQVEGVVNLLGQPIAAPLAWALPGWKRRVHDVRVQGTRNLVAAIQARAAKPRVLVNASAIGYYGSRGDEVLTEADDAGGDFLSEMCQHWESAARTAEPGVRVVLMRQGVVLGRVMGRTTRGAEPGAPGGALGPMLPMARLGLAGRVGSGRQWWSWVHAGDLARFVAFALDEAVTGPFNVCSPEPVRQADFARTLGQAVGRPRQLRAPALGVKVGLGPGAAVLLGSQRALPERAVKAGFALRVPGLEAALKDVVGPATT